MPESLPPVQDDQVVEIDLRHVIYSLLALSGMVVLVGGTLLLTKDYIKYLREQALIDSTSHLIQTITKELQWSEEKTDTL